MILPLLLCSLVFASNSKLDSSNKDKFHYPAKFFDAFEVKTQMGTVSKDPNQKLIVSLLQTTQQRKVYSGKTAKYIELKYIDLSILMDVQVSGESLAKIDGSLSDEVRDIPVLFYLDETGKVKKVENLDKIHRKIRATEKDPKLVEMFIETFKEEAVRKVANNPWEEFLKNDMEIGQQIESSLKEFQVIIRFLGWNHSGEALFQVFAKSGEKSVKKPDGEYQKFKIYSNGEINVNTKTGLVKYQLKLHASEKTNLDLTITLTAERKVLDQRI